MKDKPPFTLGILYYDGKIAEKKFLIWWVAMDTMKSLANLSIRYPGSIKNLWVR